MSKAAIIKAARELKPGQIAVLFVDEGPTQLGVHMHVPCKPSELATLILNCVNLLVREAKLP